MSAQNPAAGARAAKIVLPAVPPTALPRPALEARLDEALHRRLTLVVAGAGFGKSTLVAAWASRVHAAWYALAADDSAPLALAEGLVAALRLRLPGLPQELTRDAARGPDADADARLGVEVAASLLSEALAERLARDLVLVVEDVHELDRVGGGAQLLESLCREAPPNLHLVLTSRWEPPFAIDRLRGRGQVLEIGAAELAFSAAEVAALLPPESERLAADLHTATEGWPAAVRLAIESLRAVPPHDRPAALARLRRSSGPLYSYLAAEVLEREAPETQELLRFVSALGRFTLDLLAGLGVPDASRAIGSLARRGLFLELRRPDAEWYAPTGLLREFVLAHTPLDRTSLERLHRGAAAWLEDHGHLEDALRSLRAIEDHAAVARLLTDRGRALLRTGVLETVVEAAEAVPAPLRTSALEEVEGAARQIRGAGAPA